MLRKRRQYDSEIYSILASALFVFIGVLSYAWFSSIWNDSVNYGQRSFGRLDHYNVYRDERVGLEVNFPPNTKIMHMDEDYTVISRGNVNGTEYTVTISVDSFDERIEVSQYLSAQMERVLLSGPSNSQIVFRQMFDQKELSGIHVVFVRNEPYHDVEEHVIFATKGRAALMRFNYLMLYREKVEPEIFWIRSTLRFLNL